jgi:molecular chaperone Hsp33
MSDCLIKTLACNKQVRILFAKNTDLIREICFRPGIRSKLLRNALGTTVSVASLLSGTLKDRQRLSLKITASNSAYKLFADVDFKGNVRGYLSEGLINESAERLDELSIQQFIDDKGYIQVVKDIGMYRNQVGITDMPYRNIVDDLSHYFDQSEQTPTCCFILMNIGEDYQLNMCAGVLAQALPGTDYGVLEKVRDVMKRFPKIPPKDVIEAFHKVPSLLYDDVEILEMVPLQAFCGCSKEMMLPMLYSLGNDELTRVVQMNDRKKSTMNSRCSPWIFPRLDKFVHFLYYVS